MPQAGFEPTIAGSERPQTHALDRVANEIGDKCRYNIANQATFAAKYTVSISLIINDETFDPASPVLMRGLLNIPLINK